MWEELRDLRCRAILLSLITPPELSGGFNLLTSRIQLL